MKLQISLRRMLLFVTLVAAALGSFRACVIYRDERSATLAVLGLFFLGSAAGIFREEPLTVGVWFVVAACLAGAILILAAFSWRIAFH